MNTRITASLLAPFLLLLLISSGSAQVQRTFVSGSGSDSNPCNRTAPCRTFTQALMGTSAGGEVVVLDSAGYGPFTITQAVSIIAPQGVYSGISVFSGDGIDINAGGQDTVILRGLTINNQGSTGSGIVLNSAATLHVESCVINGFGTTNAAAAGVICRTVACLEVGIKDSIMRGNFHGIVVDPVEPSGCFSSVTIDQVRLERNFSDGLLVQGSSRVTVSNSVASGNQTGFSCFANSNRSPQLNIESCVASGNSVGIRSLSNSTGGAATVRVSNSTVTNNGIGLFNVGTPSFLQSRTNNTVEGNTADEMGPIDTYPAT